MRAHGLANESVWQRLKFDVWFWVSWLCLLAATVIAIAIDGADGVYLGRLWLVAVAVACTHSRSASSSRAGTARSALGVRGQGDRLRLDGKIDEEDDDCNAVDPMVRAAQLLNQTMRRNITVPPGAGSSSGPLSPDNPLSPDQDAALRAMGYDGASRHHILTAGAH
jgi:hypothetical protein